MNEIKLINTYIQKLNFKNSLKSAFLHRNTSIFTLSAYSLFLFLLSMLPATLKALSEEADPPGIASNFIANVKMLGYKI